MDNQTHTEEAYTPEAREAKRIELAAAVESFLSDGGQLTEVPTGERADPPKKPENNYGRGSI